MVGGEKGRGGNIVVGWVKEYRKSDSGGGERLIMKWCL